MQDGVYSGYLRMTFVSSFFDFSQRFVKREDLFLLRFTPIKPFSDPKRSVMYITDKKTLREIKGAFHEKFPFLKLEFYAKPHKPGEGSPKQEQLPDHLAIGEIRTIHNEGDFQVKPEMRVRDFEQQFYEKYGLSVQVFRKSGNLWLQTSKTDMWTLAEQNRKGGASTQYFEEMHTD